MSGPPADFHNLLNTEERYFAAEENRQFGFTCPDSRVFGHLLKP
jgi:hypothetical protein